MWYITNLCQSLSRTWNALRGKPWYYSTCAYEYKKMLEGKDNLVDFIDNKFNDPNHCRRAYEISVQIEELYKKGNVK